MCGAPGYCKFWARSRRAGRSSGCLDGGDGLRLRALRTLRDVEGHRLVLLEGAEAVGVDGGVVNEDIRAASLLGEEAEALFSVEPLDGSGSHKALLGPKVLPLLQNLLLRS